MRQITNVIIPNRIFRLQQITTGNLLTFTEIRSNVIYGLKAVFDISCQQFRLFGDRQNEPD